MVCDCEDRRDLPPPEPSWATFRGPLDGSRCLWWEGSADPLHLLDAHRIDDAFVAIVDLGRDLALLGEAYLHRARSDGRHGVRPSGREALVGSYGVYLLQGQQLHRGWSVESTFADGVVAHTVGPQGWLGITEDGEVVLDDSRRIAQIGFEVGGTPFLVSGRRKVLISDRRRTWLIGENGTEEVPCPAGTRDFIAWGDRFIGRVVEAEQQRFYGVGEPWQSEWVAFESLEPVVYPTERLLLIPVAANTEARTVDSTTGATTQLAGVRHSFNQVLDHAGVGSQAGDYVFLAGVEAGEGRLVRCALDGGATQVLSLPYDLPPGWQRAQWLVRAERVFVAVGVQGRTWLLEFGTN